MQKTYFHNKKLANENNKKKQSTQTSNLDTKGVVDINILLNRVKIEEKNEKKKKNHFFYLCYISS
jgi:hypothetical protein